MANRRVNTESPEATTERKTDEPVVFPMPQDQQPDPHLGWGWMGSEKPE